LCVVWFDIAAHGQLLLVSVSLSVAVITQNLSPLRSVVVQRVCSTTVPTTSAYQ